MFVNIMQLHIMIIEVCKIVIVVIKNMEEAKIESLDTNGDTSSLFKNPNSLSNINGSPALIDPVKAVKTIIPGLKKRFYGMLCVNSPTGAF